MIDLTGICMVCAEEWPLSRLHRVTDFYTYQKGLVVCPNCTDKPNYSMKPPKLPKDELKPKYDAVSPAPAPVYVTSENVKASFLLSVCNATSSSLSINFTEPPQHLYGNAYTYYTYRATSADGSYSLVTQASVNRDHGPGAYTWPDSGLSSGTTYYYKIVVDVGDITVTSNIMHATTL